MSAALRRQRLRSGPGRLELVQTQGSAQDPEAEGRRGAAHLPRYVLGTHDSPQGDQMSF
jgi:hypothetical protein